MLTYECTHGVVDYSVGLVPQLEGELVGSDLPLENLFKVILIGARLAFDRAGVEAAHIRMLEAHGNSVEDYVYEDDIGCFRLVLDWILGHEGKYDGLVIGACNTRGVRLDPCRSHLMYPLGLASTNHYLFNHDAFVVVPACR